MIPGRDVFREMQAHAPHVLTPSVDTGGDPCFLDRRSGFPQYLRFEDNFRGLLAFQALCQVIRNCIAPTPATAIAVIAAGALPLPLTGEEISKRILEGCRFFRRSARSSGLSHGRTKS